MFWSADSDTLGRVGDDRRPLAGAGFRRAPDVRGVMIDSVESAATTPTSDPACVEWGDPPRAVQADAAPVLSVDGFEGPLDWLLEMTRAKKIDLARLSIAALVEAFATAMEAALAGRVEADIGRWAAWTVMAATLTELWSGCCCRLMHRRPAKPRPKPRRCAGDCSIGRPCAPPRTGSSGSRS